MKRKHLYQAGKIWGDISAIRKGTVGKRIARRTAGRIAGRGLGKLFR